MEYGMPTLIETDSLEETVSLCKELDLSFIELNMNLPQYQVSELEDVNHYLRLQKQYGIFFTIHLDENLNIVIIPVEKCTLSDNSEHPFPIDESRCFRSPVQPL